MALVEGSGTHYDNSSVGAATDLTSQRNLYTSNAGDAYQGSPTGISLSIGMSTSAYGTTYTCEFGAVDTSSRVSSTQKAVKMDAGNYTQSYQVVSLSAGSLDWGNISYVYAKYISDDGSGSSSTIFVKGSQSLTIAFSYSYHVYTPVYRNNGSGWASDYMYMNTGSDWVLCDVYRNDGSGWVLMGAGNG